MAAKDKLYLNGSYEDYKAFKDWCDKQPIQYDLFGTTSRPYQARSLTTTKTW